MRTSLRLVLPAALACTLLLTIASCSTSRTTKTESDEKAPATQSIGSEEVEETSETKEDDKTEAPSEPIVEDDVAPDSLPVDEGLSSDDGLAADGRGPDEDDLDDWADKAQAFLTIYPASYVQAGGADDEPVRLEIEDWASACLRYVDPSSTLGQSLQNDPASVAAPLGYYEVAAYVNSTEVTGSSLGGINVTVELKGTQFDWAYTTSFWESFLVQFNNDGLITDVVSTD